MSFLFVLPFAIFIGALIAFAVKVLKGYSNE